MTHNSPMMDRLRSSSGTSRSSRSRFPKKGLIRILSAVILLAAGFKIAASISASAVTPDSGKTAETVTAGGERGGINEPRAITLKLGGTIDRGELFALVAQAPLHMSATRDTVIVRGDSLVRFFSLDTGLVRLCTQLFRQYRPKYGAAVILHPTTGRVLSLASFCHDSAKTMGEHLFLRSFVPAASIFKTVTAVAAIEKAAYTDSTLLPVAGRNHTLYRFQLRPEINPWGALSLGDAYARSINPAFARIGMYVVGQESLREYGLRFGWNDGIPFELPVDTSRLDVPYDTTYQMAEIASGFNRTTSLSALHGALIAAAAVNDGVMPKPSIVDSIVEPNGPCRYRTTPEAWKRAMQEQTAAELRVLMGRVVDKGTARKSFNTLKRCAWSSSLACGGKTGSINVDTLGKIDLFVGYALDRDDPARSLALAVITVHGALWTVHSAYIAAEIIRNHFRPVKSGWSTKQLTIPVRPDTADTASSPEG